MSSGKTEVGRKAPRSTALIAIALCFLASAILRGERVAHAAAETMDQSAKAPIVAQGETEKVESAECDPASAIAMLKAREDEFAAREAALNAKAAKLDAVTERLNERIASLEKARDALRKTVAHVDGAQGRDIDHLVTMYSTMKPKRAGELFNQMDIKFASELLVRMKPEIAALVLANMDSERAFTASLLIARRNENTPTE